MDAPLPSPRLARKASSLPPPALSPVLKTLGLEEEDPEDVFEIHAKEGAGAFGRVFRASYRCAPLRLAALKVIPVALEAGQRGEDIENVRREIQFLRECDHPNVVAFYGAYYKDQALWLAMEYCGGGSVGDVSRRRKLDEDEIAVITRGALHGLAYLHARKKIHRDIKGGNILLTSTGEVKIADFGVSAQLKDTMSRRGTFVGTPYWMSPEMIQDSDYDYKSDIWSLGITIIELADQKPPLFDEHPMRVLIQIPRNPPPSVKTPDAWTPLFAGFLQFCLRKDPRERPSAVECLEHAFIQRVRDVPFVFAQGYEDEDVKKAETAKEGGEATGDAPTPTAPTATPTATPSPPRTIGSLTTSATSESEARADDVTLKSSAARPLGKASLARQPLVLPEAGGGLRIASLRRRSLELTRQILSSESAKGDGEDTAAASDAESSQVGTPRESESVVDEAWDFSRSAALTSSRSSRSEDDDDDDETTEGNDASAEGFAFRHGPMASSRSVPQVTAATKPPPPLEFVSSDELQQLSVDDSFEMPAMALISKIHAAASTLAGHSTRPRAAAPVPSTPLPLPLPSAPSPVLKASGRTATAAAAAVDEHWLVPTSPLAGPFGDAAVGAPARSQPRRDLNSFSRTDATARGSVVAGVKRCSSDSPEAEQWQNPLTQLTAPCHDRVNSLLSSLSASSTSRLLLLHQQPPSHHVDASMEASDFHGSNVSIRAHDTRFASLDFTGSRSVTSSTTSHFIGAPFRVSHELNVRYNTLDAKFEGVPSGPTWASVHRQFGIALAQLRCRSNASDHVPALIHMLRRELVQRDGLDCKYIYRVSPDTGEIQRAKTAIQSGTFEPQSVSDPHVFASLLKHWLRELPTPLLGAISREELAQLVERLVKPDETNGGVNNDSTRDVVFAIAFADVHTVVTSKLLLAKLPDPERGVLLWLVDHMLEVIAKSARNAMTAHSLAVVVAPNVYRWASTTPADASLISKQVATLLRVLLAWRQRCRGGSGGGCAAASSDSVSSGADTRPLSLRARPTKADSLSASTPTTRDRTLNGMSTSLRESLDGLRSSLTMRGSSSATSSAPRESTVSGILRRSSGPPVAASTHFISASASGFSAFADKGETPAQPVHRSAGSLETRLREVVDSLWSELPLSIMLDDPPPIVRSLHTKFQRRVLVLVDANARRDHERRWATGLLARLEDTTSKHARHFKEEETTVPLSLRPFKRWLLAVLDLEAFTTLLKQERHARERLEKRWPTHATALGSRSDARTAEGSFAMGYILELAQSESHATSNHYDLPKVDPSTNFDTQQAMLDGAATLLRVLHDAHADRAGVGVASALPLAEELVHCGEQEPVLGNLLVAMSSQLMRRYHLENQHRDVVRLVERVIRAGR